MFAVKFSSPLFHTQQLQTLVIICCQTAEDTTDIRYMAACAEPPQTKDSSHPPVVCAHILLSIVPANAGSRTAPENISALPAGKMCIRDRLTVPSSFKSWLEIQ